MGNLRTDVSGLAKLQVMKTGSYFGKREAILMIDELSLLECKQVVHEQLFKNNCLCLNLYIPHTYPYSTVFIFLHSALYL